MGLEDNATWLEGLPRVRSFLGVRAYVFGFGVLGLCRVQDVVCRVQRAGCRV